ncbi:receptor-type tyrosine-protein phosphatase N2 [Ixodes scapularis]
MKVQDLKRVLKARGLSTAGNKSELVERLQTIGDASKDIPQDLHGVISSLESPGSRNMMAKEDEVTSENNDITAAPTAALPDVQRNLQSQELPGSFEAATEDGGSLPMTAKVDTEEHVDCADELLTETTSAPIVARDSAFPAPPTLLGDAQGQDGLQCHTPVQFPETNTLPDSGPTAKESLYEHKDRGTDKNQLHPSASTYDLVVEEMTQKANEGNMSSSDRGLVSKGCTEERAGYNCSVCTSLECAQTSQQTRLEELESQMSELTNRLQHADAERKKFDQMAQWLKRLENMWQERLESKEALLSLMARCEGLETRLNRLLNDQLADLHVASQEDTRDDQGVLSTSAHKTQASQTDLLGIRGVEKANEAQEAQSNKTSVDDTRPKCSSGVNRADGSEDRLGRQSLLCPPERPGWDTPTAEIQVGHQGSSGAANHGMRHNAGERAPSKEVSHGGISTIQRKNPSGPGTDVPPSQTNATINLHGPTMGGDAELTANEYGTIPVCAQLEYTRVLSTGPTPMDTGHGGTDCSEAAGDHRTGVRQPRRCNDGDVVKGRAVRRRRRKHQNTVTERVEFLNLQGARREQKWQELYQAMDTESIVLFGVAETHLRDLEEPHIHPDWQWTGCNRQEGQRKGRGVGVLCHSSASWQRENKTCQDHIWVTGELLQYPVAVCVVYLAVGNSREDENQASVTCIASDAKTPGVGKNILIMGDFNGHLGELDGWEGSNGRRLLWLAEELQLEVLNLRSTCEGQFTWCARGSKTCIDYALASHRLGKSIARVLIDEGGEDSLGSDHNRLRLDFSKAI